MTAARAHVGVAVHHECHVLARVRQRDGRPERRPCHLKRRSPCLTLVTGTTGERRGPRSAARGIVATPR